MPHFRKLGIFILVLVSGGVFWFLRPVAAEGLQKTDLKDRYIVVLKKDVADVDGIVAELTQKHNLISKQRFRRVIKGFATTITADRLPEVEKDDRVAFVVADREVTIDRLFQVSARRPTPTKKPTPTKTPTPTPTPLVQIIPKGVKRIGIPASGNTGAHVTVAVIDTGIDLTHPDLAGNIVANTNCIDPTKNGNDDHGHGSHVAGTIAAVNNSIGVVGVAPEAKLAAVKVLNAAGSGTWSSVICGIDWVSAHASEFNIKVANMSLGGGGVSDNNCGLTNNDPLHQAICNSRNQGVTYVVSAGNSGASASSFVPAAYDDAVITVSALTDSDGLPGGGGPTTVYGADDTFASFSNYGTVVDLGAPGVSVYSTYKNGGFATISGTSMNSPHVAGGAALYLSTHSLATWLQVKNDLLSTSEATGSGHTDPSGLHPEPVVRTNSL